MNSNFKQTSDYNCGPAAVAYFLHVTGLGTYGPDELERELNCTPDSGTSHKSIERFMESRVIRFKAGVLGLHEASIPILVNYWHEDDGHYGVLTAVRVSDYVKIFDPYPGEITQIPWGHFIANWYSERYGPHWGLCLGA